MRNHKDYFLQFVTSGGKRRAEKREAAYKAKTVNNEDTTQARLDKEFDDYLVTMAKESTWGGGEELQAFCQAFDMSVIVYSIDSPPITITKHEGVPGQAKGVAHLAFDVSARS